MAAAYAFHIAQNQPFIDGNKRTGLLAALVFLDLNGRAYRRREPALLPIERDYAARKIARLEQLYRDGERYELLLALTDLVEDAETLSAPREPDFTLNLLVFRDHLRAVLGVSPVRRLRRRAPGLA